MSKINQKEIKESAKKDGKACHNNATLIDIEAAGNSYAEHGDKQQRPRNKWRVSVNEERQRQRLDVVAFEFAHESKGEGICICVLQCMKNRLDLGRGIGNAIGAVGL